MSPLLRLVLMALLASMVAFCAPSAAMGHSLLPNEDPIIPGVSPEPLISPSETPTPSPTAEATQSLTTAPQESEKKPTASPKPTTVKELSGFVTDSAKNPVPDAVITLKDKDDEKVEVIADSSGLFVYRPGDAKPLAIGTIRITAGKKGYGKTQTAIKTTSEIYSGVALVLSVQTVEAETHKSFNGSAHPQRQSDEGWKTWYTVALGTLIVIVGFVFGARALARHARRAP